MAGLIVTLHNTDLGQCYVCYTRSDVIQCTHSVVLYLCRMCQRASHVMLWSHIGILTHLLTIELRSIAGVLFPSRYLSGMILLTLFPMVWDWRILRAGPMSFYWPSYSLHFMSPTVFPISVFLLWVGIVGLGSSD